MTTSLIDASTYNARARSVYGYSIAATGVPQDAIQRAIAAFRNSWGADPTLIVMDKHKYTSMVNSLGTDAGLGRMEQTVSGLNYEFKVFNMPVVVGSAASTDSTQFWLLREYDMSSMNRDKTPSEQKWEQSLPSQIRADMEKAMRQQIDAQILHGDGSAITSGITSATIPPGGLSSAISAAATGAATSLSASSITGAIPNSTIASTISGRQSNSTNPVQQNPPSPKIVKEAALTVLKDAMAVLKQTLKANDITPVERAVLEATLARWQEETKQRGSIGEGFDVHAKVMPGDSAKVTEEHFRVKAPKTRDEQRQAVNALSKAFGITAGMLSNSVGVYTNAAQQQTAQQVMVHNAIARVVEEQLSFDVKRPESFVKVTNV